MEPFRAHCGMERETSIISHAFTLSPCWFFIYFICFRALEQAARRGLGGYLVCNEKYTSHDVYDAWKMKNKRELEISRRERSSAWDEKLEWKFHSLHTHIMYSISTRGNFSAKRGENEKGFSHSSIFIGVVLASLSQQYVSVFIASLFSPLNTLKKDFPFVVARSI